MDEKLMIQKIYSTPNWIILLIRRIGKTYVIGLSRSFRGKLPTMVQFPKLVPEKYRISDTFLHYLKSHLVNFSFTHLLFDKEKQQYCMYNSFTQGFFVWEYQQYQLVFCLIDAKKSYSFKTFNFLGSIQLTENWEIIPLDALSCETYENIEGKKIDEVIEKRKQKENQKNVKRKEMILKDLERFKDISTHLSIIGGMYQDELTSQKEYVFSDKVIKLPNGNHYQKRDFLFKKFKAYKKGEVIQQNRLVQIEKDLKARSMEAIKNEGVLKTLIKKVSLETWDSKNKSRFKLYQLVNSQELKFMMGENARGNISIIKYLQNRKEKTLWFHLKDRPSAHLFFLVDSMEKISLESLTYAISMLVYKSLKVELTSVNVLYCFVDELKTVKGKVGSVTMKKTNELKINTVSKIEWEKMVQNVKNFIDK